MSKPAFTETKPRSPQRTNVSAVVGFSFSATGLAGTLISLAMVLLLLQEPNRDATDPLSAIFIFLGRLTMFSMGLGSLLAFAFLSAVGAVISAVGLGDEPRSMAVAGLAMGVGGCGLVVWRMWAWGLL